MFVAVTFVLAMGVLFPPAFFMGGTLPVMSQHLVRLPETLGRTTSTLYAVNTFGAALGAYMASFHLPERDAYLQKLPEREFTFVRAGLILHRAGVLKETGHRAAAEEAFALYKRAVAGY